MFAGCVVVGVRGRRGWKVRVKCESWGERENRWVKEKGRYKGAGREEVKRSMKDKDERLYKEEVEEGTL